MTEEQELSRSIRATTEYLYNLADGQNNHVRSWIEKSIILAITAMAEGNYVLAEQIVFGTKDFLLARGLLGRRDNE